MMEDDETTAKELKKMLAEHGHHVGETTALKCRTAHVGHVHVSQYGFHARPILTFVFSLVTPAGLVGSEQNKH